MIYKCEVCKIEFENAWTDEEAREEYENSVFYSENDDECVERITRCKGNRTCL